LKPISAVNAFGPDIDPRYTWYDEMLVSADTVAVIGYSYERGGTEVGLFNIDSRGQPQLSIRLITCVPTTIIHRATMQAG